MPPAATVDDLTEPTLNASVCNLLRADIVACRLMPNERLRLEALRERYGVGGSPVREALMRLQGEGLVELEQHKGFRVSAVSRERLLDLMRTRIEIEGLALRWSIEHGGVEWEADLLGAFHRLANRHKTASHDGTIDADWSREHRAFHTALVAACGSPTLLGIRENLFDRTTRYVALSILSRTTPRNDAAEHEQIMRAALNRDAARAVALTGEHIERTMARVMKSLGERSAETPPQRANGRGAR
ncbi:MAG: FCD domain-containing protein [Proteobacteria bacterium]|nr:FCD domain-containing protein [Pseudomonadota bacterium]